MTEVKAAMTPWEKVAEGYSKCLTDTDRINYLDCYHVEVWDTDEQGQPYKILFTNSRADLRDTIDKHLE